MERKYRQVGYEVRIAIFFLLDQKLNNPDIAGAVSSLRKRGSRKASETLDSRLRGNDSK